MADVSALMNRLKIRESLFTNSDKGIDGIQNLIAKAKGEMDTFYKGEASKYGITNADAIIASGEDIGEYIRGAALALDPNDAANKTKTVMAFENKDKYKKANFQKTLNQLSKTSVELLKYKAQVINENEKLIAQTRAEINKTKREVEFKKKDNVKLKEKYENLVAAKTMKEQELALIEKEISLIEDKIAHLSSDPKNQSQIAKLEQEKGALNGQKEDLKLILADYNNKLIPDANSALTKNESELTALESKFDIAAAEAQLDAFEALNKTADKKFEKDSEKLEAEFNKYGIDIEKVAAPQKDADKQQPKPDEKAKDSKDDKDKKDENKKAAPTNGAAQQVVGNNNSPVVSGDKQRAKNTIDTYIGSDQNTRTNAFGTSANYVDLSDAMEQLNLSKSELNKMDKKLLQEKLSEDKEALNDIVTNSDNRDAACDIIAKLLGTNSQDDRVENIYENFYSPNRNGECRLVNGNLSGNEIKDLTQLTKSYKKMYEANELSDDDIVDFNTFIANPVMNAVVSRDVKPKLFDRLFGRRNEALNGIRGNIIDSSTPPPRKSTLSETLRQSVRGTDDIQNNSRQTPPRGRSTPLR